MFMTWLLQQVGRDDPIGDLANDMKRDKKRPRPDTSIKELREYLRRQHACREAIEAFNDAVKEYKNQK